MADVAPDAGAGGEDEVPAQPGDDMQRHSN